MRTISSLEASKFIHGTDRPTADQVDEVEGYIRAGTLKGNLAAKRHTASWTTTDAAVAQYMAEAALVGAAPGSRGSEQLAPIYRDLLKDYFLAMFFQRRRKQFSKQFQRAVVVGQAIALLALTSLILFTVKPILASRPAEQVAIESWISQNADSYSILKWHPPVPSEEGSGLSVRVQYRYLSPAGKTIFTERVFLVQDGRVARVDSG